MLKAGNNKPAKMAIIAITTSSSINVNARAANRLVGFGEQESRFPATVCLTGALNSARRRKPLFTVLKLFLAQSASNWNLSWFGLIGILIFDLRTELARDLWSDESVNEIGSEDQG